MLACFPILASGNAAEQFTAVAALPIVTTPYSSSELGILRTFAPSVIPILPESALRRDLAIPIRTNAREARTFAVSAWIAATPIAVLFARTMPFAPRLRNPSFSLLVPSYGWLACLSFCAVTVFSVTPYWTVRRDLSRPLEGYDNAFSAGIGGAGFSQIGVFGVINYGAIISVIVHISRSLIEASALAYIPAAVHFALSEGD